MDNNRLDALFTGLTGTGDTQQQEANQSSIPSAKERKPKAGQARAKQKKLEKVLML